MKVWDLQKGESFPAYFITGDDLYLTDRAFRYFVAAGGDDFFNVDIFANAENAEEIVAALNTPALLSDKKTVIVKGFKKFTDGDKSVLEKYLKNPADFAVLAVYDDGALKSLHKYGTAVECGHLAERDALPVAEEIAKAEGADIAPDALAQLVKFAAADLMRVQMELRKLKDFADGAKITREDVENLVAPEIEFQVFELSRALGDGKNGAALSILSALLERGEKPSRLLAMLASQYRRYLQAALSNLGDAELAKILKVKPYAVTASRAVARNYSQMSLKGATDRLQQLEFDFKSGRTTEDDALKQAVAFLLKK